MQSLQGAGGKGLPGCAGTTKAEVNLAEKSVTLEGTAAEAAWKKAIADAGYQVVE